MVSVVAGVAAAEEEVEVVAVAVAAVAVVVAVEVVVVRIESILIRVESFLKQRLHNIHETSIIDTWSRNNSYNPRL